MLAWTKIMNGRVFRSHFSTNFKQMLAWPKFMEETSSVFMGPNSHAVQSFGVIKSTTGYYVSVNLDLPNGSVEKSFRCASLEDSLLEFTTFMAKELSIYPQDPKLDAEAKTEKQSFPKGQSPNAVMKSIDDCSFMMKNASRLQGIHIIKLCSIFFLNATFTSTDGSKTTKTFNDVSFSAVSTQFMDFMAKEINLYK